jgi:hypothetical protein
MAIIQLCHPPSKVELFPWQKIDLVSQFFGFSHEPLFIPPEMGFEIHSCYYQAMGLESFFPRHQTTTLNKTSIDP